MTTKVKMINVRKLYFGRRRAKDTVKALERSGEFVTVKVYVIESPLPPNQGGAIDRDAQIVIDVSCPEILEDGIKGVMVLGSPESGNWEPEGELLAEDCLEFYQGGGLSRFRGQ